MRWVPEHAAAFSLFSSTVLGLPDSFCLTSYLSSLTYFVFLKAFKMHYKMVTFFDNTINKIQTRWAVVCIFGKLFHLPKNMNWLMGTLKMCHDFEDMMYNEVTLWSVKNIPNQTNVTIVPLSGVHNSKVLFLM